VTFDAPVLEMMLRCQLEGYLVFDSLLLSDLDTLLDEFVTQIFVRPRTESVQFLEAVIHALEQCSDRVLLESHLGAIVLTALFCETDRLSAGREILLLVAQTFVPGSSSLVEEAATFAFVPALLPIATEQVIHLALGMLSSDRDFGHVRRIVSFLRPWFQNLRLVPANACIAPGVPAKFRKFTILSFFEKMLAVSRSLTEQLSEVFAELWTVLLSAADNHRMVLLCLFESPHLPVKERVFGQLMHHDAALICRYLAKRCRFAYWYHVRTVLSRPVSGLQWMFRVLKKAFTDHGGFDTEPTLVIALHFALLFIENAGSLYDTLVKFYCLPVDAIAAWHMDAQTGTPRVNGTITRLAELFESVPGLTTSWADEALRWVLACGDITPAYRSLVIFNALGGQIDSEMCAALARAVAFHVEHAREDAGPLIGEAFHLLERNLTDVRVAEFSFRFAAAFLRCPVFRAGCVSRAMPLFMAGTDNPFLGASARSVLVLAFLPFAPRLETDGEAQRTLLAVLQRTDSPALRCVIAPFQRAALPFVELDPYDEAAEATMSVAQVNTAVALLTAMAETASRQLADSVLAVATRLITERSRDVNRDGLAPIYRFALKRVALLPEALEFVRAVAKIDPAIANEKEGSSTAETHIMDVAKEVSALGKDAGEPPPITNCKNIADLTGMINQTNPPKISPFATDREIYLALAQDNRNMRNEEQGTRGHALSKSRSNSKSVIIPNRSFVLAAAMQNLGIANVKFAPLVAEKINATMLDIPGVGDGAWQFMIQPEDFLDLEDVTDAVTPAT
jgi:hypothetical protein